MPIYEYFCAICNGRFNHLARSIAAPPPACPRCGNSNVERIYSAPGLIHNAAYHEQALRADSAQVGDDPQAIARFLQASGRLEESEGLYGSKVYRELLARRAAGATDADLNDLTDDLVNEVQSTDVSQMAGAVMFSEQVENRMGAAGPPQHDHAETPLYSSRRKAPTLGWATSK